MMRIPIEARSENPSQKWLCHFWDTPEQTVFTVCSSPAKEDRRAIY